jgi:HTH-type transcriptional regulator/antitoxin HigA
MSGEIIRLPSQADHPSTFIEEELEARGWTLDDLASRMGNDVGINRLTLDMYFVVGPTDKNLLIGQETADQLGAAFDVSPQFFLNLKSAWRGKQPS